MRHWSLESDRAALQTEACLAVVGQYANLTAVNHCNIKWLLINRVCGGTALKSQHSGGAGRKTGHSDLFLATR